MLHLAFLHSREMARRNRIFHVPTYFINSKRPLPCDTFLAGALVAHAAPRPQFARLWDSSSCLRLLLPKINLVNNLQRLHIVFGVYVDERNGVWCTALLGLRTAFSAEGECGSVKWKPSASLQTPKKF
eukprot:IDg18687t1